MGRLEQVKQRPVRCPPLQADVDQRPLDRLTPDTGYEREGSQKVLPAEMWLVLPDWGQPLPTMVGPTGKMGSDGGDDRDMFVRAGRPSCTLGQYRCLLRIAAQHMAERAGGDHRIAQRIERAEPKRQQGVALPLFGRA